MVALGTRGRKEENGVSPGKRTETTGRAADSSGQGRDAAVWRWLGTDSCSERWSNGPGSGDLCFELDREGGGAPALLWTAGRWLGSATREVSDGGKERGPRFGEERWRRRGGMAAGTVARGGRPRHWQRRGGDCVLAPARRRRR
jgi:hypothetical protein